MDQHDVRFVVLPDEPDEPLSESSEDESAPVNPPPSLPGQTEPSEPSSSSEGEEEVPFCPVSVCIYCERPLRSANAVKCPNPQCDVWYHRGCLSVSSSGKCALCP